MQAFNPPPVSGGVRGGKGFCLETFHSNDIGRFLELANAEGWLADAWELNFVLSTFPGGSFSARDDTGTAVGFVTSFRHDRSGWIGNLLVTSDRRGKGIGETLFTRSLESLQLAGAETIWLTASKMGKSLYEKHGFCSIDTISRWTACGKGKMTTGAPLLTGINLEIDRLGWGDRRNLLIGAVMERGRCLLGEYSFAVLQPCGAAMQLGPFAAIDPAIAESVLQDALDQVTKERQIFIDAPAANQALSALLRKYGFLIQGANELMYAGVKPDYRPDFIYGLASMGSMG